MGRSGFSTKVLLVCGVLASVHLLLHLSTVTLLTVLAPVSPPLYGLVAGVHALIPFLARRLTAAPGSATITAAISGVMVAALSPSGIILLVPLLLTGAIIDLVVGRIDRGSVSARRVAVRYAVAAVILGVVLFLVSLSVFTPEHLVPVLVIGSLVGRVTGELVVAALSGVLAGALRRAGVGNGLRRIEHRPTHDESSH